MAFYPCIKQDGNVNDVKVNGTSVVDENKVAQIASYKEVTLAEYIALGDVVNTDGKLYCITDLNNSDIQGYPPLIYSDEEREVGVWRDGKPLYQKTYVLTSPSTANSATSIQDVTSLSIDTPVNIYGNLLNIPINWTQGDANLTACWVNGTKTAIFMNVGNNGLTSKSCNVTVLYTKTTDTAGSGTWNGQGGLAHHYSTNETVIGTWIDGNPLYERTVLISALPNTSYVNTNYPHGIADIDNIVEWDGYGIWSNGTVQKLGTIQFSNNGFGQIPSTFAQVDKTNIVIMTGMDRSAVSGRFIIKYTKTTD